VGNQFGGTYSFDQDGFIKLIRDLRWSFSNIGELNINPLSAPTFRQINIGSVTTTDKVKLKYDTGGLYVRNSDDTDYSGVSSEYLSLSNVTLLKQIAGDLYVRNYADDAYKDIYVKDVWIYSNVRLNHSSVSGADGLNVYDSLGAYTSVICDDINVGGIGGAKLLYDITNTAVFCRPNPVVIAQWTGFECSYLKVNGTAATPSFYGYVSLPDNTRLYGYGGTTYALYVRNEANNAFQDVYCKDLYLNDSVRLINMFDVLYVRNATNDAYKSIYGENVFANGYISTPLIYFNSSTEYITQSGNFLILFAFSGVKVNTYDHFYVKDENDANYKDIYCRGIITTGARNVKTTTVDDSYSVVATDDVVICNKAGVMTITLPEAIGGGRRITIKNINTGTVTIDGDGADTVDGSATVGLYQLESAQLIDYAANAWIII
jgi:hypothetical protein